MIVFVEMIFQDSRFMLLKIIGVHKEKLKIMEMSILQKWQTVKAVRRATLNMTAIFTNSVNVHVITELQDRW
jgi:hypothetical protein